MSTKIKNQSDLSGVFGESVSFRKVNGKVVAINRPKRKLSSPTPAQEDVQRQFLSGSKYAKLMLADPEQSKKYAAGITDKKTSVYAVALNDFLIAPVVQGIDAIDYTGAAGDLLTIKAIDDFMVTRVKVSISDASGALIEVGEASRKSLSENTWEYKTSVAIAPLAGTKITATAFDQPGNRASLDKTL